MEKLLYVFSETAKDLLRRIALGAFSLWLIWSVLKAFS